MNEKLWEALSWWLIIIALATLTLVIVFGFKVAFGADNLHYTPWLTFTNDADRERQIDSVGAIEVYTLCYFEGTTDSGWVQTGYRQIVTWEIREWPSFTCEELPVIDSFLVARYKRIPIPGEFRVVWREE